MHEPVLTFDHISKKFSRGENHGTLRDFIPAMLKRALGRAKADPALLANQEFWAIDDVSFCVGKGESLGIIGPNGAGKSTILKLLSGILRPTRGTYTVNGRLAALIEVGAGFHPDLTGRENIFLNGTILGMTRKDIQANLTRIIEFSGLEEFIETPLKRYSSGMAVRLGFACSAFTNPDVLLVDEILSVGDVEFRNRCQERMDKLRRDGCTMILVSHSVNEIRALCEKSLMLFKGKALMQGPTPKVLERYHQIVAERIKVDQDRELAENPRKEPVGGLEIVRAETLAEDYTPTDQFGTGDTLILRIHYKADRNIDARANVEMIFAAEDHGAAGFDSQAEKEPLRLVRGRGHIDLRIGPLLVQPDVYSFNIELGDENNPALDTIRHVRFVVGEKIPIPAIFGLTHSWRMPQLRSI
jgi:ABC-type polysaccharide/polyol phosphate transport system ATPase subunit